MLTLARGTTPHKHVDVEATIAFNQAVFDWCVRNAERCLQDNALTGVLHWCKLAAEIAHYSGTGYLVSGDLESLIARVAQKVPLPGRRTDADVGRPRRWLHVIPELEAIGGRINLVSRWIASDPCGSRHSVVLLDPKSAVSSSLMQSVHDSSGTIHRARTDTPLIPLIDWLRQTAWAESDVVVLHIEPSDVVSMAAFGIEGGPPVLLMNHIDHVFWLGGTIADLVIDISESSRRVNEIYRGISRNYILPVPLPLPNDGHGDRLKQGRNTQRQAMGIPLDAIVLLTVGRAHKYLPFRGLDFLDTVGRILDARPATFLVAVGPTEDASWRSVRHRSGGRVILPGPQSDLSPYYSIADLYLEGFPYGSLTGLLEAGLWGIPCVRAPLSCPPPFSSDDEAISSMEKPSSTEDYVRQVVRYSDDGRLREESGREMARAIRAVHCGLGWQNRLKQLQDNIPVGHGIHPYSDLKPIPEHFKRLLIEYRASIREADALKIVSDAAVGRRLEALVDAPLVDSALATGRELSSVLEAVENCLVSQGIQYGRSADDVRSVELIFDNGIGGRKIPPFWKRRMLKQVFAGLVFACHAAGELERARYCLLKSFSGDFWGSIRNRGLLSLAVETLLGRNAAGKIRDVFRSARNASGHSPGQA